jgi:hypothetical protein
MIFSAHAEIANYVELDVECDKCGRACTIPRPDSAACNRLIDGYYFNEAIAEFELLKRAEAIFDSRPNSNHRHVIQKKYRERVINPEDCSLLQEAIDADPPVKNLLNGSFSFHPRKRSVEDTINKLREKLASHTTPCAHCGGTLRLTEECHEACGGVFFSEEARLRWIARHKVWNRTTEQ